MIYKLDRFTGIGHEILRSDLGRNKDLSFADWNDEQFVMFCCLIGSDYCPNLHGTMRYNDLQMASNYLITGMGIKTAYKYASKYKTFDKIMQGLKKDWKYPDHLTNEFFLTLWRAFLTFRFQVVYK